MSDHQRNQEFLAEAEDIIQGLNHNLTLLQSELKEQLSPDETLRLHENLKEGALLYRIRSGFPMKTVNRDVSVLQNRLANIGEVVSLVPLPGDPSDRHVFFEILFVSKYQDVENKIASEMRENEMILKDVELIEIPEPGDNKSDEEYDETSNKDRSGTIHVNIECMDSLLNTVGEMFLLNDKITQVSKGFKAGSGQDNGMTDIKRGARELFKRLTKARNDLIEMRMIPISQMFMRIARIAKKTSHDLSKEIRVEISGGEKRMDKFMIERLADPLMHIMHNAIEHGIETKDIRAASHKPAAGIIHLRASQKGSKILIEVEDDGAGIDIERIMKMAEERGLINSEDDNQEAELIKLIFKAGFSTDRRVDETSGRGNGLDVIARNIAALGGIIDVETRKGEGTKISLTLPLTLLIARALIVIDSGRRFAIPFNAISESCVLKSENVKNVGKREVLNLRGNFIPIIRLRDELRYKDQINLPPKERPYVVIVGMGEKRAGLVVDMVENQREILLKPVSELLGAVRGIAGFTETDADSILPVIDVCEILERQIKS